MANSQNLPEVPDIHYVRFRLPDRNPDKEYEIDIFTDGDNLFFYTVNRISEFKMQTTSFGTLSGRDSNRLAKAYKKAASRTNELNKLYKGKDVIIIRFSRDVTQTYWRGIE